MAVSFRQYGQWVRVWNLFPTTRKAVAWIQDLGDFFVEHLGLSILNTIEAAKFLIRGKLNWKQFFQQAAFVGIDTLGLCLIMTTFAAMVIALQMAKEMVKQGAGNFVGALMSLAMLRELAPIMTGFSMIAMVGSAYAAELASMKISNQVDALRVLHVNPIRYLLLPRVMALMAILPLMTVITGFAGIMGGLFVAQVFTDLSAHAYLDSVWQQTEMKDIFSCLLKSSVFGYLIGIISTTIGLNTHGGAKEAGVATTQAVVWSFVMMAIFDYLITYFIYGSNANG